MKKVDLNLSEVNAEMLLNYLYPEMEGKWKVEHQGTFYRNFNSDLVGYNEKTGELQVARDSFIKLLPPSMLFSENSLKGRGMKGKINKQTDRQRLLRDMFQPFDNMSFRRRMSVEREISDLLENKLHYLLTTYFHYDLTAETNPYIKRVAPLLPFVHSIRGDYRLIRNILAALFRCTVKCTIGRYSESDHTRAWIPKVTYEMLIEGLGPEEYDKMNQETETFRQFLQEWFFPFDTKCVIIIKWHHQSWNDTDHWLLDYNTELKV